MRNSSYELQVIVDGKPAKEYPHQGNVFIQGVKGTDYILRISNNSGRKVLAILSVDGLSIMDGNPASRDGSGYVIRPYNHVDIPGWRLNNNDVAKFIFSSLPEAYASLMNEPANIGVIGCVIYNEKPQFRDVLRGGPQTFESVPKSPQAMSASRGVGTGFGDKKEHKVTNVNFDRQGHPSAELILRYDDAEGLQARGITLEQDRVTDANPFPGDTTGATPPPGWKG